MNKILRFLCVILFIFTFLFLYSCMGKSMDDYSIGIRGLSKSDYIYGDFAPEIGVENGYSQIAAHQLSAAAYDDNLHFDFWLTLLDSGQQDEKTSGIFAIYYKNFSNYFNLKYRLRLYFKDIIPYSVKLLDNEGLVEFSAVPTKDGYVSLFSKDYKEQFNVQIEYFDETGTPVILKETITGDKEYELVGKNNFVNSIDLMFIIDTTGSMGDEINFLKAELANVIEQVSEKCEDTAIRLSLLVYRDEGDEYLTKYSDFSTNIDESLEFLQKQHASGGGDFEEAVEVAYEEAISKSWSTDFNTKIIVFVADAPSHDDKVNRWGKALLKATSMGIRVITVASSGIDKKTEYFFRCGSLMTGGIYTYLTDDSGIGESHLEATVEEKPVVEYLNSMLVRLIVGYHLGEFEEPVSYEKKETNPINEQDSSSVK